MTPTPTGQDLLRQAKATASALSPDEVAGVTENEEVTVIDVREGDEWRRGHLPSAVHVPRGFLEMQAETKVPSKQAPIIVYCAGGNRSALATETLKQIGYTNVRHMSGGFTAWKDAGHKIVEPVVWTDKQMDRYSRHFVLPEVGEAGQQKISQAKVLVIGAGGLGSPALYYLGAAGVGTIGIVDMDAVEDNNLQRQIIHSTAKVGMNKAESAGKTISELNPDVNVKVYRERLLPENVDEIFAGYDVVLDATDNFSTRYLINATAYKYEIPSIYGSIYRFEGYASVFWPSNGGPCYRCMHPEPPPPELAPT